MAGRYYIKTYGCQMNEYDSARMADVLREAVGLTETQDPALADVLLMNTCSVREKAQEKVYSLLGEWRALKLQRPELILGVGGCVACAVRRSGVRPADHPPSAADARAVACAGTRGGGCEFS